MLEAIKRLVDAETTTIEVKGEAIRIRKLSAIDGMTLAGGLSGESLTAEQGIAFNAAVLSKTILEEDGTRALDNDQGRALLASLPIDTLNELAAAVMKFSGIDPDAKKKNSPSETSSSSESASL
jgi:hypothetical protein